MDRWKEEKCRCVCGCIPLELDTTEPRELPRSWIRRLLRMRPKTVDAFVAWVECNCGLKTPRTNYTGPRFVYSKSFNILPEDKHDAARALVMRLWVDEVIGSLRGKWGWRGWTLPPDCDDVPEEWL